MKEKAQAPELRFDGFTDDWEERKLGEHAKYRRGSFPQPYGNKEWYDGEGAMPFVQVVDVTNKLTLVENTKQKISKLAQSKSVFVPKGTVVVTLQGSIGRVAITQYDSFVDRTLLIFEDYEKETDERFWAYTIQKKFEIEKLKAPGGTIKTITKEALSSFDVHLPQFKEQAKIGSFFKQLDDTIALHQRKLDLLKEQKKGYLQKMFPKNGAKVPELRFAGFADDWEERKLSDIADRFDNLRVPITASDRKPGDTPYYGANGIQDYVEGFTHNGEFILVAEDGANDLKNYPVQYVNGKVWVNNHAHVLQGKKTITDNKFLMNAIKNFNIEPFLVGGGRAKLNADVMMKLNILLPTFVEQEKIGSLFSLLDKTIALHQRKLDLLKEQKKGYLQKMFV